VFDFKLSFAWDFVAFRGRGRLYYGQSAALGGCVTILNDGEEMAVTLSDEVRKIPKAEIHVHIEGTLTPAMARRKAKEHGITLPADLISEDGERFQYRDFIHCVTDVYDAVASTVRSAQDYEDITYDYLTRSAAEGCIYTELIVSSDHADMVGVGYDNMLAGITRGIDRARADTGIECRINSAMVRHFPMQQIAQVADTILNHPHKYVTGIDLAGAERAGDVLQFKPLFDKIAQGNAALGVRLHASEGAGPVNAWDALRLNPSRLGHGVRSVEDPALVAELVKRKIVLEVCPTSNVLAGIYPDYASHPLRRLMQQGVRVTLNSDDPGLFNCTIGTEYQVAKDHFGLSNAELAQITRTAIEAAYVDEPTRAKLLAKVDGSGFLNKARPVPPKGPQP
jgi:adenosine deaminase